MNKNYIFSPVNSSDAVFHQGAALIYAFVMANILKINIDPDWWEKDVTPAEAAWILAYEAWINKDNRTKLITAKKNAARAKYEPLLTKTIEALRADPKVDDADLRRLDIYIEPHTNTPTPTTDKVPVMHVEPSISKRITITVKPDGEDTKAKPPGVSHIEVAWDDELDAPPKRVSELSKVDLFSKATFILNDFEEDQRGTAVYMAARYVMQAEKSGYGPWSNITFAIIP
jgi:hypothetical protein